ncbi:MAG: hypothetical protein KJ579_02125 [Verrucomicrobia bacterium]|nr:hypothetical protein [Verrucomicrobiota bacterium]
MKRIVCLAVCLCGMTAWRAPAASRSEMLPSDVLIAADLSDMTALKTAVSNAPLGKLWNDPGIRAFLGNPKDGDWMPSGSSDLPEAAQAVLKESWALLKGQIVLAFTTNVAGPHLLAQMSEADSAKSLEYDRKLQGILGEDRLAIRAFEFQKHKVYEFTMRLGTNAPVVLYSAFANGTVLSSPEREWTERTLAALIAAPAKEPVGAPSAGLRVNIPELLKLAVRMDERRSAALNALERESGPRVSGAPVNPAPHSARLAGVTSALGLNDLGQLAVSARFEKDRAVVHFSLGMKAATGLLGAIVDGTPVSRGVRPALVPPSSFSFAVGRINLMAIWREIPGLMERLSPGGQAEFDRMRASIVKELGIDLENDLFVHMDGLAVTMSFRGEKGPLQVISLCLKDPAAVQASLAKVFDPAGKIAESAGPSLKREEFAGATLYAIVPPSDPDEPGTGESGIPGEKSLALAVAGGYLLYGEADAVREAMRAADRKDTGGGFFAGKLYADLIAEVPAQACAYSVVDMEASIRAVARQLSAFPVQELIADAADGHEDDPIGEWIGRLDWDKLPSADHIAGFFGPVFTYSVRTPEAVTTQSVWKYGK